MSSERVTKIRALRDATKMPVTHLAQLLDTHGGDVVAVLNDPRAYPKNTGDPFLGCELGFGVNRDHRGALYHRGCPESHGGPL